MGRRGNNYSGTRWVFSTRSGERCTLCGRLVEEIDLRPFGGTKGLSHWHDPHGEWLQANRDHVPCVAPRARREGGVVVDAGKKANGADQKAAQAIAQAVILAADKRSSRLGKIARAWLAKGPA